MRLHEKQIINVVNQKINRSDTDKFYVNKTALYSSEAAFFLFHRTAGISDFESHLKNIIPY